MAGNRELGLPKTTACSLREQLARTTLRNVRSQGHPYIEIREDGKRFIFFCTLCLAPCYSDTILFDHLKGNLHNERLPAAIATLMKPNPWPFNDGVLFFHTSSEQEKQLLDSNDDQIKNVDRKVLAIDFHGEDLDVSHNESGCNEEFDSADVDADCDASSTKSDDSAHGRTTNGNGGTCDLVVPGVLLKDEISDLEVRLIGIGYIAARFFLKDKDANGICKIWCEWLGMKNSGDMDTTMIPEHDFAIITFTYHYDLGRKGLLDDVRNLLSSSPRAENEDVKGSRKRKRKSLSDPEDISESLSNQYDSCGEDSQSSNSSSSRMLLDGYDDQLLLSKAMVSKSTRRELRRQQRVAAERTCDICQQKMLPGKDVATLLNRKTGRLVCSSRNMNGAFHVFHISCLIHWILLCELEIYTKQSNSPKDKRKSRRKTGAKCTGSGKEGELEALRKQINSVFCPECQGTGINIDGDKLEKPIVALSEVFRYKIKLSDGRRAWMRSPEESQNCSTGFHFPSQSDELVQENVSPLKLLRLYRPDE